MKHKKQKTQLNLLVFMAMGFELVVTITVLMYLGHLLDEKLQWSGVGVALGALIGLISWFSHLIMLIKRID